MESHIQQKPDTPTSEGGSERASAARDRALARRRRFLTGGLSAAVPVVITTLANRPALATNFCTVSAVLSGNASRPITGGCGESPGCWKNHALSNNASSWAQAGFSPNQRLTDVFPWLDAYPWRCMRDGKHCPGATMLQAINGEIDIVVKLKADDGHIETLSNLSNGFLLQICAGVLNAGFFGAAYPLTVQDVTTRVKIITLMPTTGTSQELKTAATNIRNAVSALTDLLKGYIVSSDCPVV